MREAVISAMAVAGCAVRAAGSGPAVAVPPVAVAAFADRHRKALRHLNRGSIVTASLVDAVLAARWPDPSARPEGLALVVGSAFGNQGETRRYFDAIHLRGPDQVGPMASYDVAVNAFVNFCSIFFRCTGPVQMLSSGAVSAVDALSAGLCMLDAGEVTAVVVVGIEHEAPEAYAYVGATRPPTGGLVESGGAMLIEVSPTAASACGRVLDVDVQLTDLQAPDAPRVLGRLVERMLARRQARGDAIRVVCAGPAWTSAADLARRAGVAPRARWVVSERMAGRWQLGGAGMVGCVEVLAWLDGATAENALGLVVTADPHGWLGAVLLGVPLSGMAMRPTVPRGEADVRGCTCRR